MKALIFAAGLGERMRPLTDRTPKPLLVAGGKPLIVWHLEKLAAMGVRDVVVNVSWLAEQFPAVLGDGARWGLRIHYSHEGATPLETGGGMLHALRLLRSDESSNDDGDDRDTPFLAVNGDIWTDFDFNRLPRQPPGDAHLVMVDNPTHHPGGDFALSADGILRSEGEAKLTFAGIGMYRPNLLQHWHRVIGTTPGVEETPPRFKLAPLLRHAMELGRATGTHHAGAWTDVGTPERLRALDCALD